MRSSKTSLLAILLVLAAAVAGAQPFERGDIIVTGFVNGPPAQGRILVYGNNGVLKRQLVAEPGFAFGEAAFSPVTGILHVVATGGIRRVDATGASLGTFGGGEYLAFDAQGRLVTTYQNDTRVDVYSPAGVLQQTRTLPLTAGASDLGADQCTLYYFAVATPGIQRYDVCQGNALSPIGAGTVASGPELRALRDGTLLATQFPAGITPGRVVRVSPTGAVLQSYIDLRELALDPDRASFWGAFGGTIQRIDLQTGAVLAGPVATGLDLITGLTIFGEPAAALAGAADIPVLSPSVLLLLVGLLAIVGYAMARF